MLARWDNLCVGGKSKTLKQRRGAACGGMHVDGESRSPKNGSNLAGKCPPLPQAAGRRPSEIERHQTEPVPENLEGEILTLM